MTRDLRYGLTALARSKSFTTTAALTLMLGIGATTAIFTFVDAVLLRPLPYDDADRIVFVWQRPPSGGRNNTSALNFLDWRNESTAFEHLAAVTRAPVSITGLDEPIMIRGARVSASFFDVFRIKPALGRTFRPREDLGGEHQVVVLSHQLWSSRFGADSAVIGRSLILDGTPHTVIGVLPAGSAFDRDVTQIWRPLAFTAGEQTRDFNWLRVIGRLKPSMSIEQAISQMNTIALRIARDHPDSNKGWGVTVERYSDVIVGAPIRRSLYVMLIGASVLLLLGCANLANLMLIRGTSRQVEVALRSALGASRSRLIRQFLVENVLLSVLGGAGGLGLAYGLVWTLQQFIPPFTLPSDAVVTIDRRVLAFIALMSIGTSVLVGLAPTLRISGPDLAPTLAGTGRYSPGDRSRRARDLLVVGEMALAFTLLVGVGLLGRSFMNLMQVDTGFDDTNVITMGLPIPESRFQDGDQLATYMRQIVGSIGTVPGVRQAAVTSALPMQGWGFGLPFQIAGRPPLGRTQRSVCFFKMVSPSYFDTLGIQQLRGRQLSESDTLKSPRVMVINETMAARYFSGEDPIGQRVLMNEIAPIGAALGSEIAWEIVGIAGDERVSSLDDTSPGVYVSLDQSPTTFTSLVVRGHVDPATLERAIRDAVRKISKDQALPDVRTLAAIKTQVTGADRLRTIVLLVFAALAVGLAGIGLYGVIAYSVAQRRAEIGIRSALGASSEVILIQVVRQGMMLVAAGVALGGVAALALTGLLSSLLLGVTARDPPIFVGAALLLTGVACVACYAPARQAAGVDPLTALRHGG